MRPKTDGWWYCPRCVANQSIQVLTTFKSVRPRNNKCFYCDGDIVDVTEDIEIVKTSTDWMVSLKHREKKDD